MKNEEKQSRNDYIRSIAINKGKIKGFNYYIVKGPMEGLNGYIEFKKRPVREKGCMGILIYVPVHGGITYAANDKDGRMLYGFDTAHCDSNEYPRNDVKWIKKQILIMLKGILKAAEVEKNYLKCLTNKGKGKWADMVYGIAKNKSFNFGVAINILSGEL